MRDMCKKCRNLTSRIVSRAHGPKVGVRGNCLEKGITGVESPSGAARRGLISYPVEESIRDNIRNPDTGWGVARARLTTGATISIANPTEAELAATQVGGAAAVLAGDQFSGGKK